MKEKKKPNGIQLLLRAVVRDPDGKVISDTGRKPSKSFVIAFLKFFGGLFDGVAVSTTDTSNASSVIYSPGYTNWGLDIDGAVNDDAHGIVVGTGDTVEDNEDYKLDTQLTEGIGAGNVTHGAMTVEATAVVGANVDIETKRAFTNNTGSLITVKEAGMYAAFYNKYFCIIRDVLEAAVDVPDKCSLTVYYTVRTTV